MIRSPLGQRWPILQSALTFSLMCLGYTSSFEVAKYHLAIPCKSSRRPPSYLLLSSSSIRGIESAIVAPIQEEVVVVEESDYLHLLSLQHWGSDSISPSAHVRYSSITKAVWKWKDTVLGDGRDFFVPRPKTLKALQAYLCGACSLSEDQDNLFDECIILSNCARFDILLRTAVPVDDESLIAGIANAICHQVLCYNNKPQLFEVPLDWPNRIIETAPPTLGETSGQHQRSVEDLSGYWKHMHGAEEITRYLCTVAAGMATRSNRPDRDVPFRPFSSRDAHIMLQLKRTLDLARDKNQQSITASNKDNKTTKRKSDLSIILQFALQAGKMVRNPAKLPQIEKLRPYGSDSKTAPTPPSKLTAEVTEAAMKLVIEPIVLECVTKFRAQRQAKEILQLRKRVTMLARNDEERKWVLKRLHEPTIMMREGKGTIDTNVLVEEITAELNGQRASISA